MKISYKKIKVKRMRSWIVDHYYSMTIDDFLPEEDVLELEQVHIKHKLMRSQGVSIPSFLPELGSGGNLQSRAEPDPRLPWEGA